MGCDPVKKGCGLLLGISIHASRMGCDLRLRRLAYSGQDFNPRIPYGMRQRSFDFRCVIIAFQSTHPVWDATQAQDTQAWLDANFNPRIPYGMRQGHVLGVELQPVISIHASRMGCDRADGRPVGRTHHFNPRIPYGMRRLVTRPVDASYLFQSTHPVWDATPTSRIIAVYLQISIHASRMGCDAQAALDKAAQAVFQSTHPVWDATSTTCNVGAHPAISIHASRMGCDCSVFCSSKLYTDFNPRIPYGMRRLF